MTDLSAYPHVKPWTDGTGTLRYRYRHAGVVKYTKEQPGTDAFDAWYEACITGQAGAPVIKLRNGLLPKTLGHSWQLLLETREWQDHDPKTIANQQPVIEALLVAEVKPGLKWRDAPWLEITPAFLQKAIDTIDQIILAQRQERARKHGRTIPTKRNVNAGRLLMIVLRKLAKIARDAAWMPMNPTLELKAPKRHKTTWRAWTEAELLAYEARHPYGTTARTIYELAMWLGTRRSDIATIRWDQLGPGVVGGKRVTGFHFFQYKGRNGEDPTPVFRQLSEGVQVALAHIPEAEREGTLLKKANGLPFDHIRSLSRQMYNYTREAGLKGCVLHGLRCNFAEDMAEAGATIPEMMAAGGWVTPSMPTKYARGFNRKHGSVMADEKLIELRHFRKGG